MQLGEFACAVGELNLLADQVAVQIADELLRPARGDIEPESLPAVLQANVIDEDKIDELRPGRGEERLAACPDSQLFDLVAAQVVQERGGVAPGDLNLAAVR